MSVLGDMGLISMTGVPFSASNPLRQDIAFASQQLNLSQTNGIGTVLRPSRKKPHQREIGAGPGMNF